MPDDESREPDARAQECPFEANVAQDNGSIIEALVESIANALGLTPLQDRPLVDVVVHYIQTHHLLLILDNF
ncbi:MAG: hypothetical protein R2911_28830 [Caldilineaceae bacterium]